MGITVGIYIGAIYKIRLAIYANSQFATLAFQPKLALAAGCFHRIMFFGAINSLFCLCKGLQSKEAKNKDK